MTRYYIILLCCLLISTKIFAASENELAVETATSRRVGLRQTFAPEIENAVLNREQQLKFGLVVLNQRFYTLREEGYAHFLRELLRITNFSAEEAVAVISGYQNSPQRWIRDLQQIQTILLSTGNDPDE